MTTSLDQYVAAFKALNAPRDPESVTVELAIQLGEDANRTREAALADGYTMAQLGTAVGYTDYSG